MHEGRREFAYFASRVDPSSNTDRVTDVLIVDGRLAGGGGRVHVHLLHAEHQAGER
jgi:hypothetical protein